MNNPGHFQLEMMCIHMLGAQKSPRERQISRLVLLLLLSMRTTTPFSGLFCFIRTASCFITQSCVNSLITRKPCRSCTSGCPVKPHRAAIRKTHPMGGPTEHRPTSAYIQWNPQLTWDSTGCVRAASVLERPPGTPALQAATCRRIIILPPLWCFGDCCNYNYNPVTCPALQNTYLFECKSG